MAREIIRVEPLSTYLERWKAPTSAVTRHGGTIYVSGFPPFDPATGELHAMSYFWGWGNVVQYSVIDVYGRAVRTVDIEVTGTNQRGQQNINGWATFAKSA